MKLDERIEKIKPYFALFNVSAEDGAAYVVVKFPQTWALPDGKGLQEAYNVQVAPMQNGLCFVTELSNGAECIFDALDYVIEFNKRAEERKTLLLEKAEELKKIFASEPIDKLRTLKFVFESEKEGEKPATKKGSKGKKNTETVKEPEVTEKATEDDNEPKTSLMALAEKVAGE